MTEFLDLPFPADDDRSARAASLRSRAAVQAQDRDRWLALFTEDAVVADPVGPSPFDPVGEGHRGKAAIGAFFESTIAANPVSMGIRASRAGGNEVANEATVTVSFPDGGTAEVDLVAVYEVDGEGLIRSMKAYWEMDQMRFRPAGG